MHHKQGRGRTPTGREAIFCPFPSVHFYRERVFALQKHASAAASAVKVSYQDVCKPILTVQEAIKACSFLADSYRMEAGAGVQQSSFSIALKCSDWGNLYHLTDCGFKQFCNVVAMRKWGSADVQLPTHIDGFELFWDS
jgi:hypothetical protein